MTGHWIEETRRTYTNRETGLDIGVVFFRERLTVEYNSGRSIVVDGRKRMQTSSGQPVVPVDHGQCDSAPREVLVLTGLCEMPFRLKHLPTPPADG